VLSDLARRALSELTGTALLVAGVIGSAVMAQRLSPDDAGLQLLQNSVATAAVLVALILVLQPVSAAFNPVVSLADALRGVLAPRDLVPLAACQVAGGFAGAVLANLMFDLDAVSISGTARDGTHLWLGEVVATAGLVLVIVGLDRSGRGAHIPVAVASWIAAAYWFTSSTSFANPAVTVGRMFSDTPAGIDPASVPAFLLAQVAGGAVGLGLALALVPGRSINDKEPQDA
jgi:glycerol uptake facilitator-like aquaporin